MCGISGIYRADRKVRPSEILNSLSVIKHRGPDDMGIYIDRNFGVGNVRLSIIDLSKKGHQPMVLDKRYHIVYNGEIYNYIELRNQLINDGEKFLSDTDTEVILKLYKIHGKGCLKKLRGMFAFCIYDKKEKSFFCARDRFGIKPLYYYFEKGTFLFSSEIKGILCNLTVKQANYKMIYDFLAYSRTDHTPETCFKNIYTLPPGHYLDFNEKKMSISKWYSIDNLATKNITEKNLTKKFRTILDESVRIHMRGDVSVGSCLSGGVDSSSLVTIMRKNLKTNQKLHTFSAVYNGDWEKDEKKYIDEVANKCEVKSHFTYPDSRGLIIDLKKIVYHQEEPFSDTSIFASWCVMKEAHKHKVKVLLDGQGADELLGYDYMSAFYFYELLIKGRFLLLVKEICFFVTKQEFGVVFSLKLFGFLLLPHTIKKNLIIASNKLVSKSFSKEFFAKSSFMSDFFKCKSLNESVIVHLKHKLAHLLRFEDKNSMAFSIETRVPYLDHILVQEAVKIPAKYKIKNGVLKYILKESMKEDLPDLVYKRSNKIGFETPEDTWFKNEKLLKIVEKYILRALNKNRPYLDKKNVKNELEKYLKTKRWNREMWKIVCLEIWFEVFIES